MDSLRSWFALGKGVLILRLAGVGAVAGLASWVLVFALHLTIGTPRPSVPSLLWAIPRGMLFGAILGVGLAVYWGRRGDHEETGA